MDHKPDAALQTELISLERNLTGSCTSNLKSLINDYNHIYRWTLSLLQTMKMHRFPITAHLHP
jgi:hypothetical protein